VRVVLAGGAGFVGSHLADALAARGDSVVILDDLSSGSRENVAQLEAAGHELIVVDVAREVPALNGVDAVLHLASPASPPYYLAHPLETLAVGSEGTRRLLELAASNGARFLLASTSEVYGDPAVHPQVESYWGNVNPIGPRSVYDEAKRFAEAITMAYHRARGVEVAIARIFNTYGPRLHPGDGRVVSNFICQALQGEPLTIFGDGTQTRSFCYVDDQVAGLLALLDSSEVGPINIGNPDERSMLELAEEVRAVTGSEVPITFAPLPENDPARRCPDISVATASLGWAPAVSLRSGLEATTEYFRSRIG